MDINNDFNGLTESSYQITDNQSIPVYADVQTYPCSNCGRCFNAESLRKHQPICKKTSQKQTRKVFDTGKQRATDSDVPYAATRETTQFYKDGIKPKQDNHKKKTNNWREGHNELVRTIRQARRGSRTTIENDPPIVKQVSSQIPTDYIQCEFCQRLFNKYSAERHIPFCETQFKRKQMQYTTTNNIRSFPGNNSQHKQQQQQQVNSAPSTLISRHPQRTNSQKDSRKPPLKSNIFKRPTFNETTRRNTTNHTPPKYGNYRISKIHSAAGDYLPKMMRTGRTIENNGLNVISAAGRGQQKSDISSQFQQHTNDLKLHSSYMNGNSQQQKIRPPIPSTAAKHCHQCGNTFPIEWAKFCCECGEKRFGIE